MTRLSLTFFLPLAAWSQDRASLAQSALRFEQQHGHHKPHGGGGGGGSSNGGDGIIPLQASDWSFTSAVGPAPRLTNDSTGALHFTFPTVPSFTPGTNPVSIGYLETPRTGPISGTLQITLELDTTGSPIFQYQTEPGNTCVFDAHARPIIDTFNDSNQYDRWWSNPTAFDLQTASNGQQVTLTIPLDPSLWSGVFGEFANSSPVALSGFQSALRNVRFVGLTFGGGCFFGHGVLVTSGTAQLKILNFSIQ